MLHVLTSDGRISFRHPPAEARPSHWLIGIAFAGREYATCRRLEDLHIEVYLPFKIIQRRAGRSRVVDVVVPLLRPYFFVPASISDDQYLDVKHTAGVFDFLQVEGKRAVIKDRELERARYQEITAEQKRQKRILESGKGKHFIVGEAVNVKVGFATLDGHVDAVSQRKVKVKLCEGQLFGRDVVEVDLGHIERRIDFSLVNAEE